LVTASYCSEALELISSLKLDLTLMDVKMPILNGVPARATFTSNIQASKSWN
jgi:YesN/AraC family two-component response regulator